MWLWYRCIWYSRLSHNGHFYKTDTSVKQTPRVGSCLSLLLSYFTLYKTDISLRQTPSVSPKGVHFRDSWLYCWFARDVTAAMLVVKNKNISLLWELNSIFRLILREKILLFWPPTWPPCHVVANQEFASFGIPGSPRIGLQKDIKFQLLDKLNKVS